jgi:hypothetical protein
MTDHEITLPPLPESVACATCGEEPFYGHNHMRDYARAAILLDRQQRAAPGAEPVQTIIALKSDEQASLSPGAYQVLTSAVRPSAEPVDDGPDAKRFTAKQLHAIKLRGYQDAEAVMRQALDALRVVHTTVNNYGNGTERGELLNAIDALRAALEPKQC